MPDRDRAYESRSVILMVDDDPDDIFLTQRAFEKIDWRGRFQSAGGAVEMFTRLGLNDLGANTASTQPERPAHDRPDIIILDLNMPTMNGFDALDRIRSHKRFHYMPIVVLSTSDHSDDIDKAYRCGANSFITKPVTTDGMIRLAKRFRDYWFDLSRLPARPIFS